MKRKGNRSIPDFSSKKPASPKAPGPQPKNVTPTAPVRAGKPQATSSKSGRRGT